MREKCDGTQPQCSSCVTQNRPCTYKTSPKKRGVQTGYIRTLELTLSSLIDEVPGCAEALDGLFSRQGEAQRLFNPDTGGQQDLERHNKLHRRWNKSRARREINRILSADGASGSHGMSDRGSDDGTDTDIGPRPGSALLGLNRPPTSAAWSPSEGTNPSPMTAGNTDDGTLVATSRSILALTPNHRQLLDIYFSYTHCWFPVLERSDLLKTAHQCEREVLDPSSASAIALSESSSVAELWAAMALASYQDVASHASAGSVDKANQPASDTVAQPETIYKIARRIIPSDDGPFSIQHARALLILSLINIGQRKYTAARMQIGMARQVAEDFSSSISHTASAHVDRKAVDAVLEGCCVLDAMSAIIRNTSTPEASSAGAPSIHAIHSCIASVPEDGLDEWQTWAPCLGFSSDQTSTERGPAYALSTFNQLHDLMRIIQQQMAATIDESSRLTYTSPASPSPSDRYTLDTRALSQAIRYDLPSSNFIRAIGQATASVPSAYVVRIAYTWAHIILSSRRGVVAVAQSLISALADIVEQFIIRFGAAATPPILVPLISSVVQCPEFSSSQRIVQQRWHVLLNVVQSTWNQGLARESGSEALPGTGEHGASNRNSIPQGLPAMLSPDAGRANVVTSQYSQGQQYQAVPPLQQGSGPGYIQPVARGYGYNQTPVSPSAPGHPTNAVAQGLSSGQNMYRIPAMSTTHPGAHYAGTAQIPSLVKQGDSPSPSVTHYTGPAGDHTVANSGLPPPHVAQMQPMPSNAMEDLNFGTIPVTSQLPLDSTFSSGGVDYDSLLDDLASTDYLERLDGDIGAQFMANLGFAPGSDSLGAVMGEYSGL